MNYAQANNGGVKKKGDDSVRLDYSIFDSGYGFNVYTETELYEDRPFINSDPVGINNSQNMVDYRIIWGCQYADVSQEKYLTEANDLVNWNCLNGHANQPFSADVNSDGIVSSTQVEILNEWDNLNFEGEGIGSLLYNYSVEMVTNEGFLGEAPIDAWVDYEERKAAAGGVENYPPELFLSTNSLQANSGESIRIEGFVNELNDGNDDVEQVVELNIIYPEGDDKRPFSVEPSIDANGVFSAKVSAVADGAFTFYVEAIDDGGSAYGDNTAIRKVVLFVEGESSSNYPPTYTIPPTHTATTSTELQEFPDFVTNMDDGDADKEQTMNTHTYNVTNYGMFETLPSISYPSGTLRYKLKNGVSGESVVSFKLKDDGGTANGGVDETHADFKIIVPQVTSDAATSRSATTEQSENLSESGGGGSLGLLILSLLTVLTAWTLWYRQVAKIREQ